MRLAATKPVTVSSGGAGAEAAVRALARAERAYQEELGRGLAGLSEGAFKALRRQLPVTRQKVRPPSPFCYAVAVGGRRLCLAAFAEVVRMRLRSAKRGVLQVDWEKIGGYRLGQDIGGGRR